MTYGLNDICLVPARISKIEHRAECCPYNFDGMLPLFTAPMNSIINENNYQVFLDNKVNTIIPRGVDYNKRWELSTKTFVAFGLAEFESFIKDFSTIFDQTNDIRYVCVDIANGHMQKLIDLCKKAKSMFEWRLVLMAGNIANPQTYLDYAEAGIDFVRIGIGGGSACFIKGTQVTMADGSQQAIETISKGDVVKTLNGPQKVLKSFQKKVNRTIVVNNSVECTTDHKFLVINKSDKAKVNNENLKQFAFYIEAQYLSDKYLLVSDNNV